MEEVSGLGEGVGWAPSLRPKEKASWRQAVGETRYRCNLIGVLVRLWLNNEKELVPEP